MGSKKHMHNNSNYDAALEGSISSLTGLMAPSSPTQKTPRGGAKKKKVRTSAFGDSFSGASLQMLAGVMETPGDDGWMKVGKKAKKKKKPHMRPSVDMKQQRPSIGTNGENKAGTSKSRNSLRRTFSGVNEEDLQVTKPKSRSSKSKKRTSTKNTNGSSNSPAMAFGPAHTAAYYSDEEIKELVRRLVAAENWEDALEAIRAIRLVLKDENPGKKADAARKLFKFQVIPALIHKLQNYGEDSDQITEFSARILVQLSYFEPNSKQVITMMGGIDAMFDAAQHYLGDMYVSGNVIVLFSNLALDDNTRPQVSMSEYMDYVLEHMRNFPDEAYTQRVCCKYLANVGVDPAQVEILFAKKGAMPLVALAFQNHRTDEGCKNVAKEALEMFLNHGVQEDDNDDDDDDDVMGE